MQTDILHQVACNFIKKETSTQVFSWKFCEIFKNTFFTEHLSATASLRRLEYFIYEYLKSETETKVHVWNTEFII